MTTDELSTRLFDFAVRVGKVVEALPKSRLGRQVANQLIRCGTWPAPRYEEALAAENEAEAHDALRQCLKELRESRSWLQLTARAEMIPEARLTALFDEVDQLCQAVGQALAAAGGDASQDGDGAAVGVAEASSDET
jgi:four helix bundle protein